MLIMIIHVNVNVNVNINVSVYSSMAASSAVVVGEIIVAPKMGLTWRWSQRLRMRM